MKKGLMGDQKREAEKWRPKWETNIGDEKVKPKSETKTETKKGDQILRPQMEIKRDTQIWNQKLRLKS